VSFGGWFNIQAEGASGANVPLLRVFDPSGARLASVYRQNQGGDALWVHHSGAYNATTGKLALGAWGHVRLHVIVAGSGASTVEVFLNGTRIYQTTTASLGTAGVLTCQIGNNTAGQAFELAADTLEIATPG